MHKLIILRMAFVFSCAAATKDRAWKTGHVVDANSTQSSYSTAGPTTINGARSPDGTINGTAQTPMHYTHVKTDDVIIAGEDYVFNVKDSVVPGGPLGIALIHEAANRRHGCRFVVGEDMKYSQEKTTLFVIDPDGKRCKLEILRQVKLPQRTSTPN